MSKLTQSARGNRKQKSLAKLKKEAWDLLSKIVRITYANSRGYVTCYTCGAIKHWKEMQAGHAIPGRTESVLLDEEILRPQDSACNVWKNGMHHIFTTKLIEERGMDWWREKLLQSNRVKKWDRVELEKLIERYKSRLKELEAYK